MDENAAGRYTRVTRAIEEVFQFDADSFAKTEGQELDYSGAASTLRRVQSLLRLVEPRAFEYFPTLEAFLLLRLSSVKSSLLGATVLGGHITLPIPLKTALEDFQVDFLRECSIFLALSAALAVNPAEITADHDARTEDRRNRDTQLRRVNEAIEAWNLRSEVRFKEQRQEIADWVALQQVGKQASHFANEAANHQKYARWWLWGAIFSLLMLFTTAATFRWYYTLLYPDDGKTSWLVQFSITKAVFLAGFFYLVYFCARIYSANRHNAIVNCHRANALKTYEALVGAAAQCTKGDIVLTKAAECIFAPLPSGFSKSAGGDSPNINVLSIPQRGDE